MICSLLYVPPPRHIQMILQPIEPCHQGLIGSPEAKDNIIPGNKLSLSLSLSLPEQGMPQLFTNSLHSNHVTIADRWPTAVRAPNTGSRQGPGPGIQTANARTMKEKLWTLAFVLILLKKQLEFFRGGMCGNRTQGQPFNSTLPATFPLPSNKTSLLFP